MSAVTVFIVGTLYLFVPGKTVYNHRSLSEWLCIYVDERRQSFVRGNKEMEAEIAIRHIGTNGIPILINWLRTVPSEWRSEWVGALNKRFKFLPVLRDRFVTDEKKGTLAFAYSDLLGPELYAAVPDILKLCDDSNPKIRYRAILILSAIMPPKPMLNQVLAKHIGDRDSYVRELSEELLKREGNGDIHRGMAR